VEVSWLETVVDFVVESFSSVVGFSSLLELERDDWITVLLGLIVGRLSLALIASEMSSESCGGESVSFVFPEDEFDGDKDDGLIS